MFQNAELNIMINWRSGPLLCLVSLLGGCAAYPLPQQYEGLTTEQIVASIRCDARRAVRRVFYDELRRLGNYMVTKSQNGNQFADDIDADVKNFKDITINSFIGIARHEFEYYATTQAAYEFTLDITEENLQGASVDFLRKLPPRVDTIGISASADRTRQNIRRFTVQDSFLTLATGIPHKYCEDKRPVNYVYPIAGVLPVSELINTYIHVNQFSHLREVDQSGVKGTDQSPVTPQMADTIMFTTKLSSKNNPSIAFNPPGIGLLTSAIGFTNENTRQDINKVIVTLATAPVSKTDKGKKTIIPSDASRTTFASVAINSQRVKNFEDAVISLSNTVNSSSLFARP